VISPPIACDAFTHEIDPKISRIKTKYLIN
jgi:hypothetical protein